jgi:carbonic anhydrase
MGIAEAAYNRVNEEFGESPMKVRQRACEQRSILASLSNLLTFSWIKERVDQGSLTLHGWYFDMENGQLLGYDKSTQQFAAL